MLDRKKIVVMTVASILAIVLLFLVVSWRTNSKAVAALDAENPTPEQIELIVGLLADESDAYLGRVIEKLQEIGQPAVDPLVKLAKEGDASARILAAAQTLRINEEAGLDAYASMVDSPDRDVREAVIVALNNDQLKSPRVAEVLARFEQDEDPTLRASAAEAMGKQSGDVAVQALERLANDPHELTARHASRNLAAVKAQSQQQRRSRR